MFTRRLVLGILFGCILPLNAQNHQHGTMSQEDGKFNPYLTTDNRGTFYLAYVERQKGLCNVMLRTSRDGQEFSAPVKVNDQMGDATVRNENPPKVAVAPNGEVYLCWANERGKWKGNIRFARSTNGGKNFSPAININSDAMQSPAGHAFQSVAVGRKGEIFVTWIDERQKTAASRGGEIWMSISHDRGKSFSPNRKILSDVCECCRTNLQIDSSGSLFLSYRTVPSGGPMVRDIILARSTDNGNSFQTQVVSHDGWEVNACPVAGPGLTLDKKGRIGIVWFTGGERPGLYFAVSRDHGGSFSQRKLLDPTQELSKHATTVSLPDGKVLVAWDDVGKKTFSSWGVLDLELGLLRKMGSEPELAYPVTAAKGRQAVIAGLLRKNEVFVQSVSLEK